MSLTTIVMLAAGVCALALVFLVFAWTASWIFELLGKRRRQMALLMWVLLVGNAALMAAILVYLHMAAARSEEMHQSITNSLGMITSVVNQTALIVNQYDRLHTPPKPKVRPTEDADACYNRIMMDPVFNPASPSPQEVVKKGTFFAGDRL